MINAQSGIRQERGEPVLTGRGSRNARRAAAVGLAVFAATTIAIGGAVRPALGQAAGETAAAPESPVLRADGPLSAQADHGETLPALGSESRARAPEGDGEYGDARPYTLESAVSIALRNNRQLAVSQYDLDVANKQVSEAYGALFPEIDGFASMQRNLELPSAFLPRIFVDPDADPDDLIAVTFGADNQWNAGLTLNQPLFDAGVFVGVGTAGSFRNLAREALRGSAQGVATTTRIAYLNVLLAQEAVRVTQNSIERVRQTLEETRALNRAGLASDYDVLRLEVQLANIEPNLRRAQNEVDEARRVLAIEMGLGETASAAAFGELHQIDLSDGAVNTEDNVALLAFAGVPGGHEGGLRRAGGRRAIESDGPAAGTSSARPRGGASQVRADTALSHDIRVLQLGAAGTGERSAQLLRREPGSAVHDIGGRRSAGRTLCSREHDAGIGWSRGRSAYARPRNGSAICGSGPPTRSRRFSRT